MDYIEKEVCKEKHINVTAKLNEHDEHFTKIDEELDILKGASTRTETVVQNLCEQIKELVTTMKEQQSKQQSIVFGVMGTIITILIGFVIWYIQSLPR